MSVLIKGMEMPTSCWDCEVGAAKQMDNATCPFYSMEYLEQENYQDKIADGCPLVPVPPHGRLIDADAMLNEHYSGSNDGEYIKKAGVITPQLVERLPTIIPADKDINVPSKKDAPAKATNIFDKCERYENCVVEIWTNTETGESSVGWWEAEP